jgi:uncharacterized membrane protein
MARKKNRPRQIAAVALAIAGVAGLSVASAAQLTTSTTPVIAGVSIDAACDTAVAVTYGTTFNTTMHAYAVSSVTISGINVTTAPNCVNRLLDFTLLDASNAVVFTTATSTPITLASHTVTITAVNASTVAQIAVVIH